MCAGGTGTIQRAVDAAKPGDWILIGPGDYKTSSSRAPANASDVPTAVLVTTPRLHIRGMNRNTVVVDGTTRGPRCNATRRITEHGSVRPRVELSELQRPDNASERP
jgi:hypothetical protein